MNAELDPNDVLGDPLSVVWSDYDGDEIYGDFEMVGGVPSELRSFEPGIGKFEWSGGNPLASSVQFYHGNQIDTTRFMTDSSGEDDLSAIYTAFGEGVDGTNHRYSYAGAYGYQTHDDLRFLHVGHRYYDANTGRFLQRDPMGLVGGLNVYAYVRSRPVASVDPSGLYVGETDLEALKEQYAPHPEYEYPEPPSTERELEELKKAFVLTCAIGNLFSAFALPIATFIDQLTHPDEPANPLFGGDYENW
jgi:RHS repeat-associated protein